MSSPDTRQSVLLVSECFHEQVFLVPFWNIGENTDHGITVLFVKFGSLPAHCIEVSMMATSAACFFFGLLKEPIADALLAMILMHP